MFGHYKTVVFDCDGVILDSNKVKTEAFRLAAAPYGAAAANALVDYHTANGGISRYAKFTYFLDEMVPGQAGPDHAALLAAYAEAVRDGLLTCAITPGLDALRAAHPDQTWLVASGGDQAELHSVFGARGLKEMFNGGIFGSPDTKDTILAREKANGTIQGTALFLGDSTYDHRAATAAGLDFIFVSGWSEVKDWPAYVAKHGLDDIPALSALLR